MDANQVKQSTLIKKLSIPGAILLVIVIQLDRLLFNLGSALPGEPELSASHLWHLWWPVHNLLKGSDPETLAVHAYNGGPFLANHLTDVPLIQSLVFSLLNAVTGNPLTAFNLTLLVMLGFLLSAIYSYFQRYVQWPLALGIACAFGMSAWVTETANSGDLVRLGIGWLPVTLVLWDRCLESEEWWRNALFILAVYGGVLSGISHLNWILLLLLPYVLITMRHKERIQWKQTGIVCLFLLALLSIYPFANMSRAVAGLEPAFGPESYVIPETGGIIGVLRTSGTVTFGLLGLSLSFRQRGDHRILWLAAVGVALLMGAGLLPEPAGMLSGLLGMPHQMIAQPSFMLGVALFAAWNCIVAVEVSPRVLELVPEHIHSIVVSVGLLFIAIAGSMIDQPAALQPIQFAGVPTYDLYISLAHEPEDYFVLNYPTGLFSQADGHRVGGDSSLIRYAAWHHKRTIGGAGPFYNPLLLNRMSAGGFLNPLTLDEGEWSESASALNEAVVTWRIGAVVVHPDLLDEESLTGLSDYLAQVESLCSPVNRDGLVYYRPIWHPEGCPES